MKKVLLTAFAAATALSGCAAKVLLAPVVPAGQQPKQVTILYVADLHAQLRAHPELFWRDGQEHIEQAGGFARVAAAIAQIRKERGGQVLVLDAGDTIQGSGAAALTQGRVVVGPLNALGLDAAIPGNWEVVYGAAVLKQRARELAYPLIAANLRDAASGERLFPPSFIKEVSGVKVAVVGFTDPDVPRRQPPAYSAGLRYDGAEVLPSLVEEARTKQGAEVVLLMTHLGLSKAVDLAAKVKGVDVHLSGDTHELRAFWEQEVENVFAADPVRRFGGWLPRPSVMTLRFKAFAPKGERVTSLEVAGEPVQDDKLYTVAACEREGDATDTLCRIPHVQEPRVLEIGAHEAVRRYLASNPPISGQLEGRAVGLDLPKVLRTQQVSHAQPHR